MTTAIATPVTAKRVTNEKTAKMLAERNVGTLESVAAQCSFSALAEAGRFERAFTIAQGVKALRALLTDDAMQDIMALQNTALGFRTDKTGGYDAGVVRDALIEATIRGLAPVGNQFNIIAGRFYCTKEGFTAMLRDHEGLTDLRISLGVPRMQDGGAIVKCGATWKIDGTPDAIECEIPIRVNAGMGADAILGKAERKLRARIWNQITGSVMETPDGDAAEGGAASRQAPRLGGVEAVRDKLGLAPAGGGADSQSTEALDESEIDPATGELLNGKAPAN